MPPRKRAASAAEATEVEQPETEAPEQPDADGAASDETETTPDTPDTEGDAPRSDLQTVEQPCPECVPNGWPEGAFSIGCTHGTWIRDNS
ncbi:hypothetical protein ACFXKI_09560 [Streptomyces mirabilis]|uniref:hypothetical protein n=1 Tax=Streptomyces mirabilis TaxID=68239 RepID=UPI0036CD4082